jgi:ribosomal protein S27AE
MDLEYTDAPAQTESVTTDTMACPYCGTILPKDAKACTRCDWTREATTPAEPKASDAMAILLSIIPGLGHIYKGHKLAGFLWMLGAIPVGIFVLLAAIASAGFGIGLFFFYLIAVMLHAYAIEDRIVPTKDEGEQY